MTMMIDFEETTLFFSFSLPINGGGENVRLFSKALSLSLFLSPRPSSSSKFSLLHAFTLLASLAALAANSYPYSTHFPKATPLT